MNKAFPTDLVACAVLAIATIVFTLTPLAVIPLRMFLGLVMALFVPGYVLIAALFPRKDDLDGLERLVLSVGLSVAVVPFIGLGLNFTPWGIRLAPVVLCLAIFTIALAVAASLRRSGLPLDERFNVEIRKGFYSLKDEITGGIHSKADKALTILLVFSILLSILALIYIIATPKHGENFTEFYILGPNGKACDYPVSVAAGNESTVIVGLVNHEFAPVNYTMRLTLNNTTILSKDLALEHNQTWEQPLSYILDKPGNGLKLEFLLYKEGDFASPYRDLHLWVNVSD